MKYAGFYQKIIRPLLFRLDPETAHHIAINFLKQCDRSNVGFKVLETLFGDQSQSTPELSKNVFGLTFPNPIGLAAGFDKNGIALRAWEALNFGFIEIGTITSHAQPGNPRPRIFRVPSHEALINRLGFNNRGASATAEDFARRKTKGLWPTIPVGINLGKSKITPIEKASDDYAGSFEILYNYGDYFVVNVSSPNTPGLRLLQEAKALTELLGVLQAKNESLGKRKPLLLKIAPDLTFEQMDEILALIDQHHLSGIIATNTTIDHAVLGEKDPKQTGGLSGKPLQMRSTEIVKFIAKTSPKLPIIAVGGIDNVNSAKEKLDAGASLIQIYTGFIYKGPNIVSEICKGL